jgi:hypothetical protein
MKEKFYLKKSFIKKATFVFALVLLMVGCYEWKSINQPTSASPNSSFEVELNLQRPQSEDPSSDPISAYAYFGVILPEGWTIKDTITFEKYGQTEDQIVKDTLVFSQTHVETLTADTMKVPSGYKWWAAKSLRQVEMIGFTTGHFKIKVFTNEAVGEFKMKYVMGDDEGELPRFPYSDKAISNFIPITIEDGTNVKDIWQNEEWHVYPNPTTGIIFIDQPNVSGNTKLKIYDLNGRLWKQEISNKNNTSIDLQGLPKGHYFVVLERDKVIKTKQIVLR